MVENSLLNSIIGKYITERRTSKFALLINLLVVITYYRFPILFFT